MNILKIENPSNEISNYSYLNNEKIEDLSIEEGITNIGERAFANCKNLKVLNLPKSLVSIGPSAFQNCENLTEVTIPHGVKKIGYRAFADCKRLRKITIPEGVEEIDWAAFSGCENLEEITLPSTLKKLDKQLFLNCKKLKKINLPSHIKDLPDELFRGCNNLNFKLTSNIKKIGNRVFEDCYRLSFFPEDVTEFGENCFKNCRSLISIKLNSEIQRLNDGMFDGCSYLADISYQGTNKIKVGKKVFRNCYSLNEVPTFIANYNDRLFENCIGLIEIDPISSRIPFACFRGCKNLTTVYNQQKLTEIDSYAFSGCESLEEIDLSNLPVINAESFSNCKRLRKVILSPGTSKIKSRAFFNCTNLSDISLPECLSKLEKEAFRGCSSIKSITIPPNLIFFEDGALSFMDSLEEINVSPYNKVFITPDHKILINQDQQKLVLYASGLKDKSYSLEDYVVETDLVRNQTIIRPIAYIGEYAFAGAKHLEELGLCGCTKDIEITAFTGCDRLKKLNVIATDFGTCPGFNIRDHGRYYFAENSKETAEIPFEHVEFTGDVVQIFPRALQNFRKVKKLTLPKIKDYQIASNAFDDCELLTEVAVPNQVVEIYENAFPLQTKLIFENGLVHQGLIKLVTNDQYIGSYKLYILADGTYNIEQNGKITTITKKQIEDICSHPEYIEDNPILYLDFMNSLMDNDLGIKLLFNGILMKYMSIPSREILLKTLKPTDGFYQNVLRGSHLLDNADDDTKHLLEKDNFETFAKYVEILRKHNVENPLLYSKILISHLNPNSFEKLVQDDLELLTATLKRANLLDDEQNKEEKKASAEILENGALVSFIEGIKRGKIKDRFLFNKAFVALAKNPLLQKMLNIYDANTKRVIILSGVMENSSTAIQNLNDLLTLMKITGALEEDPIIRQQAATFICDNIFRRNPLEEGNSKHLIVGDDIHRVFNFPEIRDEFDKEFADFFRENYTDLIAEERKKSGFIQRVYLNFREISRTSTSDKGSQRKLKVTLEKCKSYLSKTKFDGVTEQTKELAYLIGEWYDRNEAWLYAKRIHNESLAAPRNIFTKITIDEEGNKVYDMNSSHDLKDSEQHEFTFEWLPKQDYDNLILGKYCNCCAHVDGAGQGIMRASMILEDCQNLVIRNNFGEIVSKATIYVNRKEGYAVFNTLETSLNYRQDNQIKGIYDAFMRGATAFLETYNQNNPDSPISYITIGSNRNTMSRFMTADKHPKTETLQSIYYGTMSIKPSGYNGDWESGQNLVLKK